MLAILILLFILILVLEVPALLRSKEYKSVVVFFFFYILGVYMGLAQFYGWPIYNPLTSLIPIVGELRQAVPLLVVGWI